MRRPSTSGLWPERYDQVIAGVSMRRLLVGVAGVFLAGGVVVCGAERGTPAEAQTMLSKAIVHYQAVGRTRALAQVPQLASRSGLFRGRDFCKPLMCLGRALEKGV